MPELETISSPKIAGFVDPKYNNKANQLRIQEEEEALAKLMEEQYNEEDTSEDKEPDGESKELSKESVEEDEALTS